MKTSLRTGRGFNGGFTLVELLAVMAVVASLTIIAMPAINGPTGARQFTNGLVQIAGTLEQAREYATAQNTYVWVAFYPYDPATVTPSDNSGDALGLVVYASADGTDPVNWSPATVDLGAVGNTTVSGTTLRQVFPLAIYKQTAIRTRSYFTQGTGSGQIPSLPSGVNSSPTGPAESPVFQISFPAQKLSFPGTLPTDAQTGQPISIIQFTPSGNARISGSPVDSIRIDFQRSKAGGILDTDNIAALRINGLTGLTTIYRK